VHEILLLIFLVLSAFFSGSETAFFSLNKLQIKKLEKYSSPSSNRILKLVRNPRQLLSILLLGNTMVNVALSAIAAIVALRLGEVYLKDLPEWLPLIIQIIVTTLIILLFGEIIPKLMAYSFSDKWTVYSSLVIIILSKILWPFIKILNFITSLFTKPAYSTHHAHLTSEDFKNIINSKATQGSLNEHEKHMIASIFRFSNTNAYEIIVPRVDIIAHEASEPVEKLKELMIKSGHSRIPIYKKNIDNIIGMVYAKDMLIYPEKKSISSLLRPALFIPENMKIQHLLNLMKTKKVHIAIVVDEYGGTSGLLTLEDILEELVGEILDEYDKERPMLLKVSNDEYIINGRFSIAELNHRFLLDIDENEYDNVAEFLYDHFNRVPHENDSFVYNNKVKFTVTNTKAQRIIYAKLKILVQDEDTDI